MTDDDKKDDRETRNAIFAARDAAEKAMSVSREEILRRDFGLDIPTSLVPLPSRGLVYAPEHPLHLKDQVEIRGMTTREEDILMSRALIRKGTVISELIKSCMITQNVDVTSLVGGDRNALMVAIRILGYGADYSGHVECPACQVRNEISVDLNNLEVRDLGVPPVSPGENRFHFKLPTLGADVVFKLLTGREEEEIMQMAEAKKKKGIQNDNLVSTRLTYSIVSVNGVTDKNKLSQFISMMPARDSNALRHYMDKVEPGMDMKFNFECKACEHTEVMPLPLGPTFFWPNAGR